MRHGLRAQRGFTLIELMISLVLGLLVVGAATGIFLSNQKTYRATESLARVQESGRVAFELMARDVREAAGNPCGKNLPVANVLNGASDPATRPWWMNWEEGIGGYDNGALTGSSSGTDALQFLATDSSPATVTQHDQNPGNAGSPANFKVNSTTHGLKSDDIILVCDYTQASILQINKADDGNVTVEFNKGNGNPGNCTKGLGVPVICTANGSSKSYGKNSLIAKLYAVRWYVADSKSGNGRALYRVLMDKGAVLTPEEVTDGIQNMQLTYLVSGANGYVPASASVDWKNVVAVKITLTLLGTDRAGEGNSRLQRTLTHVVTLRNRTS